jgi:hypothetical protein
MIKEAESDYFSAYILNRPKIPQNLKTSKTKRSRRSSLLPPPTISPTSFIPLSEGTLRTSLPSFRIKDDNFAFIGNGDARIKEKNRGRASIAGEGKWMRNYSNLAQIARLQQKDKSSYEIKEENETGSESDFGRKVIKGGWRGDGKMEEEEEGSCDEKLSGCGEKKEANVELRDGIRNWVEEVMLNQKGNHDIASPIKKLLTLQSINIDGFSSQLKEMEENEKMKKGVARRLMRKMISLPNLWTKTEEQEDAAEDENADDEDGDREEVGKRKGRQKKKVIGEDERFYECFERVLERYLMRLRNKKTLLNTG